MWWKCVAYGEERNVSALAFDDKWEGEKERRKKKEKGSEKRGRGNGGIDAYGRRVQYRESMFF